MVLSFPSKMAKQPFDAFSPSGTIEQTHYPSAFDSRPASISPSAVPQRGFPSYIPSQTSGGRISSPIPYTYAAPISRSSSQRSASRVMSQYSSTSGYQQNIRPLSPPFSRTSSTEDSRAAAQIQGWRLYTKHLRENAQGERAHMEADRARMEEVMAEERTLWDQERDFLKAQITDLESQLAAAFGHQISQSLQLEAETPYTNSRTAQNGHHHLQQRSGGLSSGSAPTGGSFSKSIRQESGRNPDGSPFYAPAPRNPSRTFEDSQNDDLRVDNMTAPRETPLRVTSKELTQLDFGLQAASADTESQEGSLVGDSIDISHLQPELEGVPIKTSAVAPAFAAKVLSPNSSLSPSKPPPHIDSPIHRRDIFLSHEGLHRSGSQSKKSTLEVIAAPETHRLTMNAGHTPNHSIHKFELGDSGNATPTQSQHLPHKLSMAVDRPDERIDENIDPDPELRGPLGLRNDAPKDELFLAALTDKLKEIKDNGLLLPSQLSVANDDLRVLSESVVSNILSEKKELSASSERNDEDDSEQAVDEAPVLRVKASMNFGRPLGSL